MKDELKLDEIERKLKELSKNNSLKKESEPLNEPDPFDIIMPNEKSSYDFKVENEPQPSSAPKFFEPKVEPVFEPEPVEVEPAKPQLNSEPAPAPKNEIDEPRLAQKDKPKAGKKSVPLFSKQKNDDATQLIHRDRGVALSRYLESIEHSLNQIALKQNEQVVKSELGEGLNSDSNYLKFLDKNLNKLTPSEALNILYEISLKFKDGSADTAEFNKLSQKVLDNFDTCANLSQLNENVKLKARKKTLIRKMNAALAKWNESPDKKILDEIYSLKSEGDDQIQGQFNTILNNFNKGKDITNDLNDFCSFKLSEIAEPPVLKERTENANTIFDMLNSIQRELIELRYLQPRPVVQPVAPPVINNQIDIEPLKSELHALNLKEEILKPVKEELKLLGIKNDVKAFQAIKDEIKNSIIEEIKALNLVKEEIKAFNAVKDEFKTLVDIKDELKAFEGLKGQLEALNYKDEIKSLSTQLKGVKNELKALKESVLIPVKNEPEPKIDIVPPPCNEVQSFTQTPAYALAKENPQEDEQPPLAQKPKKSPAKKTTAKKTAAEENKSKRGRPKKEISKKEYDDILNEISQLKSELSDEIKTALSLEEEDNK